MPRSGSAVRGVIRAAVALVLVASPSTVRGAPDPLFEYLEKYRCPVADRLQRLFDAGNPATERDRFIAVTLLEHPHAYVQCLFRAGETRMLCEAASGFYYNTPGAPRTMRLPPDRIAALGRLGFSTDDSAGNFSLDVPVSNPPDFGRMAELILKALYDGYGARVNKTLEFEAPFAPGLTLACDPVG